MAEPAPRASLARRFGWVLLAAQVTALVAYAGHLVRATPRPTGEAQVLGDGTRFAMTEARRRDAFAAMMRGENDDRERAEKAKEGLIWNRNHDSYFHQYEWARILWTAARLRIPGWKGWLILDEGLRGHWTSAPGVPVLADEAPLSRTTRPLDKRPVMIPAAPTAPASAAQRNEPVLAPPAPTGTPARPAPPAGAAP